MRAMILERAGEPLREVERETPEPGPSQVRLRVLACGVCRTDLHVVDGELEDPSLPLVLGHEVVGVVDAVGAEVTEVEVGQRVGMPWLGGTCGACSHCRAGRENLCDDARFTGYHLDGGYAEAALADARYCLPLPRGYDDAELAPLLCAGLIGYRTLRMAGPATTLGLYGFGAAAHILAQVLTAQGQRFLAFTRPGDESGQAFARELGAVWAGGSDQPSPEPLDAALLFAPVGELVPKALRDVRKGGVVVSGGIHMSDIPSFPYRDLWQERSIRSVANLTRRDGFDFFDLASRVRLRTRVSTYSLVEANRALDDLREGRFEGAAVLVP